MFALRRSIKIFGNVTQTKKVRPLFVIDFNAKTSVTNRMLFSTATSSNNDTYRKNESEGNGDQKNNGNQSNWDFKTIFNITSKTVDIGIKIAGLFFGLMYMRAKEENEKLDRILNSSETRIKFIEALLSDDVETVSTLIRMGVDVTKLNPNGSTFFHFAATCAGENTFKMLCKQLEQLKNSDSIKDRNGFTPLHRAVFKGNETTVRVLVNSEYGNVMINEQDATGYTPLHMAAYMGFNDIVDILLSKKADSTKSDYHDQTPYDYAVQCGYSDIAKKLKPSNLRSRLYKHPFLNERLQHQSFEGTVLAGVDPFEKDKDGNTALHGAVSNRNRDILIELLNYAKKEEKLHIHVNEKNKFGESPLLLATLLGLDEIVECLLEQEADPNIKMCSLLSLEDQEKLSFQEKETYNAKIDQAPTPLHIAASLPEKDKALKITALLLKKIDRNKCSKDKAHWSPVHRAAAQGNTEVLKLLLDKFYNVNIYSDSWSPLHEAVCSGQVETVKYLLCDLKEEINVSPQEECGETPLHIAVKKYKCNPKDFLEIINLLIEHHANLAATDNDNKTASDYAFYLSNWEVINRLRGEEYRAHGAYSNSYPFYERKRYNTVSSADNSLNKG